MDVLLEGVDDTIDALPEPASEDRFDEITIICRAGSRRIYVPSLNEYRDVGTVGPGVLVIDSRDPAFGFMRDWAERDPEIEISGIKFGVRACPICSERLVGDMADHARAIHVDNGEEEETARPRPEAVKARVEAEREKRRQRVSGR